ncbi:MAG: glycoside hydrolase family 95 protein [Sedimentisphaerales bacterium]|nr:glycoside hydrolase family 95 protein [Sedimentisphaerales bacterium]
MSKRREIIHSLCILGFFLLAPAGLLTNVAAQEAKEDSAAERLWYKQPASKWEEALPLGNGRLGAMVFGTVPKERLALNEESLWAGAPLDVYPEGFAEHLKELQRLVLAGKIDEARQLGVEKMTQSPTSFRSYEPLADLIVTMGHGSEVTQYRRELDLETGVARVRYRAGGTRWEREVLISAADDVLVVRLGAETPGKLNAKVALARAKDMKVTAVQGNRLHMDGQIVDVAAPEGYEDNPGGSGPGGPHMRFAGRLLVRTTGGTVEADGDALAIANADEAVILFTAATDFNLEKMTFDRAIDPGQKADAILAAAAQKSWAQLQRDHMAEHRSYFNRVSLDLGGEPAKEALPIDERLEAVKKGGTDNGLTALYFQYGRYLLMSSSRRPGRLPANLQGIWNHHMWAPWEADYHLNINLQMNYWPADLCNLSETIDPLADWFARVTEKGEISAHRLYHARGWVAFTAVDLFGRTTPSGSTRASQFQNGVLDPLAGAWMAMTLWRHYEFTGDRDFLDRCAYPVLKGAGAFLLDYLVEDQDGVLVVVPSTSPENSYVHPETGAALRITRGSTYHTTIARVVLQAVIDGSRMLNRDAAFRAELEAAVAKLPPFRVGKNGTIQEWIEDYQEREPTHRHVSHLIGLHPFSLITPNDPALFAAADKTIERRGFGGDVGWSNAWKSCFFARLRNGDQAQWYLNRLIGRNALANLMNGCWPGRVFQIDGNFAGATGIAEMLLQSHDGTVHLLPALPAAWKDGSVSGLRARGGFLVDIAWHNGQVASYRIEATRRATLKLRAGDQSIQRDMNPGEVLRR